MLKVLTLNINYYGTQHGGWPARKWLIRDTVERVSPDIVALQAVAKDANQAGGADQASQLAEMMASYQHVVFQPATELEGGVAGGNGFISRRKLEERLSLNLSFREGLEDKFHRIVLGAQLDTAAGPIHLFNAHFSWVEEQAVDNVRETVEYIRAVGGAAILVGDLNQGPGTSAMRLLCDHGWLDAWDLLHPGAPGFTFESGHLSARIDWVWITPALRDRLQAIEVVDARDEENRAELSDHLGLTATFDL